MIKVQSGVEIFNIRDDALGSAQSNFGQARVSVKRTSIAQESANHSGPRFQVELNTRQNLDATKLIAKPGRLLRVQSS